jgi:hypothetical protein
LQRKALVDALLAMTMHKVDFSQTTHEEPNCGQATRI